MSKLKEINELARAIRKDGEKWSDAQKRARKQYELPTTFEKAFGLGDAVAAVTKFTGVKAAVDYVFDKMGKDCGCDQRQDFLNELFSVKYSVMPECFTESELEQYTAFKKSFDGEILNNANQKFLSELWAKKFRRKIYYPCSSCPSSGRVFKEWIEELDKLASAYESDK